MFDAKTVTLGSVTYYVTIVTLGSVTYYFAIVTLGSVTYYVAKLGSFTHYQLT